MDNAMLSGDVRLHGDGGDDIAAYAVLPQTDRPVAGIVVIHHMPGYDWATKEIVRRFGAWGWSAICPNLHHRAAPGADPDDAAAATRAAGGVPDGSLVGDVSAAREYLLAQPSSNGLTGVIGFCSGGRQSVLAACRVPFDAAVDCYGAFVLGAAPGHPAAVSPLTDLLPDLDCPVLGIFGADDSHPSPDEVSELDARLTSLGKPHDFHSFDGAGHAFLAADRASHRPTAAVEAWSLVRTFFGAHLGGADGRQHCR